MTTTMTPAREAAGKRMKAAWQQALEAKEIAIAAEAEFERLRLLEIADRHPGLTGFSWLIGYYFETSSGSCEVTDSPAQQEAYEEHGHPDDELLDLNASPDVVRKLCGTSEDDDDHQVTVEKLREVSF